jgi:hypothetical protein
MVSKIVQSSEADRVGVLICEIGRHREQYLNGKQSGLDL